VSVHPYRGIVGGVAPQTRANTGAHGLTQANNRGGHGKQTRTWDDTGHGKDTEQPKSVSKKLPDAVIDAGDTRLPIVMKDTSTKDQTPKVASSQAKEKIVSELRKLQTHDLGVIQM
jgi:hypothetical protein